jgi:hypothetical protein
VCGKSHVDAAPNREREIGRRRDDVLRDR